jgi:hypothetical protein
LTINLFFCSCVKSFTPMYNLIVLLFILPLPFWESKQKIVLPLSALAYFLKLFILNMIHKFNHTPAHRAEAALRRHKEHRI